MARTITFGVGTKFTSLGVFNETGGGGAVKYHTLEVIAPFAMPAAGTKGPISLLLKQYSVGTITFDQYQFDGIVKNIGDNKVSIIARDVNKTPNGGALVTTPGLSTLKFVVRMHFLSPLRDKCVINKKPATIIADIDPTINDAGLIESEFVTRIVGGGSPDDPDAETFVRMGTAKSAGTTGGTNATTGTVGAIVPNSVWVKDNNGQIVAVDSQTSATTGTLVNTAGGAIAGSAVTYSPTWSVTVGTSAGGTAPYTVEAMGT